MHVHLSELSIYSGLNPFYTILVPKIAYNASLQHSWIYIQGDSYDLTLKFGLEKGFSGKAARTFIKA